MPQNNRVFAWRRDEHDPRDHVFGATAVQPLFAPAPVVLPPMVDLEPKFQPVYDQLNLGSCVYNACGGLYEYLLRIEGKTSYTPVPALRVLERPQHGRHRRTRTRAARSELA